MKWLPILIFSLFGFFLVNSNFSARLGMIDDHEIPMFLGSDGAINLSEFPTVIESTEIGRWGEYQRFRPSYFTLRVIETALWRDNGQFWYMSRYFMLVLSLYLGWLIASSFFPKIVSYLIVFYLMTFPFWSDILTRLGPSEIYAVPAFLMFLYGLLSQRLWLVSIGYLVAVGSKENFLVLFPFLIVYAGYRLIARKTNLKEGLVYLTLIAYTAWITAGIVLGTGQTGADVYGSAISYPARLAKLYSYKRYIVESRHLQIPLVIMVIGLFKIKQRAIAKYLLVGASIAVMIASQYLFYDSQIPSNMRYDFPVMLLFPALQLTALSLALTLIPKKKWSRAVKVMVHVGMIGVLGYLIIRNGYEHIQQAAKSNAMATQRFAASMDKVTPILIDNPEVPLVFVSEHFLDYEPIVAVSRYLNAKSVENKFILKYTKKIEGDDPLKQELEARFETVMEGRPDPDRVFGRFSPTSELVEPCYQIVFNSASLNDSCEVIAKF